MAKDLAQQQATLKAAENALDTLLHDRLKKWYTRMVAALVMMTILSSSQGQIMRMNVVVAKDGSGKFTTIMEAIKAAPKMSATKYYIGIGPGNYKETVFVDEKKTNLVLIGAGMDRTIISGNKTATKDVTTSDTATVGIKGLGFVAQNITFENTAGPYKNQSVALLIQANHSAFYKCRFKGYQDTLYTKKYYQFFRDCEIYGTVDFIFGDSTVVFQNCKIYVRKPRGSQKNTITAQKRESQDDKSGIVIQNCTITAEPGQHQEVSKFQAFLGRPWGNFSRTVIMQSFLDDIIDPTGWLKWEGRNPDNVHYAEYENRGPGNKTKGRVQWSRVINSSTEAAQFTVRNFIQGDKWIPSTIPFFLDLM